MSRALKWKLIAGFLLVFIAGGATGVFVTMSAGHRFMFPQHPPGAAARAMKMRLQWQLRLSEEQMAKVSPIIDKAGAQLEEIRGDTGRRVRDIITEVHRKIAPILTPEQQQRLRQMEERRRRWFQNRQHAGRTSPAGPPASPEASPE
jgi:Spy/CpxP family protein refolding chaperone